MIRKWCKACKRRQVKYSEKGVYKTTEFLELFLKNLLPGENNPLQNRTMHTGGGLKKQYIEPKKQYIGDAKRYIDKMIAGGLTKKTATNAVAPFSEFGLEKIFSRADVALILNITITPAFTLLKKLANSMIVEPVSGFGKGKYRFNPSFFKKN